MKNTKLKRLQQVLGLIPFTFSYETIDGVVMETEGDALEVGKKIYITTPEGQLPTPDGEYEMSSGMKLKVKDGMIEELSQLTAQEDEMDTIGVGQKPDGTEMSEDMLEDGTIVSNKLENTAFEVGQDLFVIAEDGTETPAPDADHKLKSGKIITTIGGKITKIAESEMETEGTDEVETEMADDPAPLGDILMGKMEEHFKALNDKIDAMMSKYNEMSAKVEKFSSEPASTRVYDKKGFDGETPSTSSSKAEALMAMRNRFK